MKIKNYNARYSKEITDLFCSAVHAIDSNLYSPEQKDAWAPRPPDYQFWQQRLEAKKPILAMVDGRVAGFIELESDGHIDCLYVHPDSQKLGYGTKLLDHVILLAKESGCIRLYVEASEVALPLFKKMGFLMVQENILEWRGVKLINYTMALRLS